MYGAPGTFMVGAGSGQYNQPPGGAQMRPQADTLFRYGEQALWSSQFVLGTSALANQQFRLFATPLGQQGQGWGFPMSISETNLKIGGQVPGGVAYDVFGIALQVLHASAQADAVAPGTMNQACNTAAATGDLMNVLNSGVLSWNFTQSEIDIAPAMLVGQGGGAYGGISTTQNLVDRGHLNNGNGNVWLYRQYPVMLPGTTVFAVLVRFGSRATVVGANYMSLRVVLLGYFKNLLESA